MPKRLIVPADLELLLERREGGDRRASGQGRSDEDRRKSEELPTPAARSDQAISLSDVAVPSELIERRKDGARRDQ